MTSRNYFVYIITNKPQGVLYVGVTSDLGERIVAHKAGGGGVFTVKYGLTQLVYFETFGRVEDAIDTEKRWKRWRRAWKIALVEKGNPAWRELPL